MPSSWANEKLTRKRYPTRDDYGTEEIDYGAAPVSTITIDGCWLEPLEEDLDDDGQILTVTAYRVAAPYAADVEARDLVIYEGITYKVDQEAQRVKSPTGALNQSLFTIRRWKHDG